MTSVERRISRNDVGCVLLDIEGTTSSIRFVHDVMFPHVREHLVEFLESNWTTPELQECLSLLATDLGHASTEAWLPPGTPAELREQVCRSVIEMMDQDRKATGLKQLQGLIWKDGFTSGQLVAPLYDDVLPALQAWRDDHIELRIYSSGSVAAQRLFFGHTIHGNLLDLFAGHYDTTIGSKKDADSYRRIVDDIGKPASSVVFISDVVDELAAAEQAGLQTVLSARPDNPAQPPHGFDAIERFDQLQLTPAAAR